jgi:hypothetical protein
MPQRPCGPQHSVVQLPPGTRCGPTHIAHAGSGRWHRFVPLLRQADPHPAGARCLHSLVDRDPRRAWIHLPRLNPDLSGHPIPRSPIGKTTKTASVILAQAAAPAGQESAGGAGPSPRFCRSRGGHRAEGHAGASSKPGLTVVAAPAPACPGRCRRPAPIDAAWGNRHFGGSAIA